MGKVNICEQNLAYSNSILIDNVTEINMDTMMSDLIIEATDNKEVTVEFYVENKNNLAKFDIYAGIFGNGIDIRVKRANLFFEIFSYISITTKVAIPKEFKGNINIKGVSLDVWMNNINAANINASVVSGSFNILDSSANIFAVSTVSGNTHINNIHADVYDIKAKSGSIELENIYVLNANSPRYSFNVTNVSGRLKASLLDFFDDISIKNVSGSIELNIPNDIKFSTNLSSVSGKVRTNETNRPIATVNQERAAYINASTVSGSLTVNK